MAGWRKHSVTGEATGYGQEGRPLRLACAVPPRSVLSLPLVIDLSRNAAPASRADVGRAVTVTQPNRDNPEKEGAPRRTLTGIVETGRVARGAQAIFDLMPPVAQAMQEDGPDVYRRMEGDAEISASLFQIRQRIVGRAIEWAPPDRLAGDPFAQEVAEYVEAVTRAELDLRADVEHLLRAITRRFSVSQVVWRPDTAGDYGPPGVMVPDRLRAEIAEHYAVHRDGTLLSLRAGRPGGLPLTPPLGPYDRKFILHRHGAEPDVPMGVSILDGVYWEWKFLRAGMGFWLDLLDRFGLPSVAALFDSATDDPAKAQEMANVIAAELTGLSRGQSGALAAKSLVVPQTGGRGEDFERFAVWLEKRIRKGILSTTLTVDVSDVGARAQGEVSEREVDGVARWHGSALEHTLARTIGRWTALMRYGAKAARAFPVCRLDWRQPASFEHYLQAAAASIPVSLSAAYNTYNVPEPADGDPEDVHVAPANVAPAVMNASGPGGDFADSPFGPRTRPQSRTPLSTPRRRS